MVIMTRCLLSEPVSLGREHTVSPAARFPVSRSRTSRSVTRALGVVVASIALVVGVHGSAQAGLLSFNENFSSFSTGTFVPQGGWQTYCGNTATAYINSSLGNQYLAGVNESDSAEFMHLVNYTAPVTSGTLESGPWYMSFDFQGTGTGTSPDMTVMTSWDLYQAGTYFGGGNFGWTFQSNVFYTESLNSSGLTAGPGEYAYDTFFANLNSGWNTFKMIYDGENATAAEFFLNGVSLGSDTGSAADFTGLSGVALTLITADAIIPAGNPVSIDNIVVTVVPEPTQMVFVAGVGATLGAWRLRKLRRNGRDATAC